MPGTPATISGFTAKMCTGTSLQYKASSVSSTETLTWTAPSDLTGFPIVEISAGRGRVPAVKRHTLPLTARAGGGVRGERARLRRRVRGMRGGHDARRE